MKLSEAIMLGSTQLRLNPESWYLPLAGCGCLLGMAMKADGDGLANKPVYAWMQEDDIVAKWPWLRQHFPVPSYVRGVDGGTYLRVSVLDDSYSALEIISRMAYLVHVGHITLERAVSWVASIEPSTPETNEGSWTQSGLATEQCVVNEKV